jgi:hypothetical protein
MSIWVGEEERRKNGGTLNWGMKRVVGERRRGLDGELNGWMDGWKKGEIGEERMDWLAWRGGGYCAKICGGE